MPVFCFECNKQFSCQSSINRHNKELHQKSTSYVEYVCPKKYMCETCNVFFKCNKDLRCHLEDKHEQCTELVELQFEKFEYFTAWMAQEERQNVQYSKTTGSKRHNNIEKHYYECVRSYRKYDIKVDRKRTLKSQGSCKMLYSCSSQIILSRNTESDMCHVSYFKTHYGHGEDIEHLHVRKSDKDSIASKLILGVPAKSIMNKVRDNIGKDLKRLDLIKRGDIHNIKRSYRIDLKDGCRHRDDATSVHMWVSECLQNESHPILFYKQQGRCMTDYPNFLEKDFCLIFMNAVQKDIFLKYGPKLIAIDGTHGLN